MRNIRRRIAVFFIIYFCLALFYNRIGLVYAYEKENRPIINGIKFTKIFEKNLAGEAIKWPSNWLGIRRGNVRAFDRKHTNAKNAIIVAFQKIYIFDAKGNLVHTVTKLPLMGDEPPRKDINSVKIGHIQYPKYRDTIVLSYYTCGPSFWVYDGLGNLVSTVRDNQHNQTDSSTFLLMDLNGDGIDDLVSSGRAFYTDDMGMSWQLLWENKELLRQGNPQGEMVHLWLGNELYRKGEKHILGYFDDSLVLINKKGDIVWKREISRWIYGTFQRVFTTGDFNGDGSRDEIAVINEDRGELQGLDNEGNNIFSAPIEPSITGPVPKLWAKAPVWYFIQSIATGKLKDSDSAESIIIGGPFGIAAYNSKGDTLWSYILPREELTEEGRVFSSDYLKSFSGGLYNLFITDLDNDGKSEIIAGARTSILILSNKGDLIQKIGVDGFMFGGWGERNATIDIADINNDGLQEILAFTSSGTLYCFGIDKGSK